MSPNFRIPARNRAAAPRTDPAAAWGARLSTAHRTVHGSRPCGDIVIALHHAHEEALAETARTNQEKEVACHFHTWQIHGLVGIIFVLSPQLGEIRDSIWDKFVGGHKMLN